MGCSGCTRTDGCEAAKGPQRTLIDEVMATVYPDRTWGHPDDEARFLGGIRPREVKRLARAIASAARAPTFYRPGGPDDLCDYVYVLCVGREPALLDVRDGLAAPDGEAVQERYLRVIFSTVARAAAMQEVALELERADPDQPDLVVRELPQPGVYDPKLLKRMRAIVDLIEANEIEHLDFGMVDKPHPEALPGDYVERYGVEPTIVNFLFYAQPARTSSTTLLSALPEERGEGGVAP
jgi:hypothetical protein